MFDLLQDFNARPTPFSRYTAKELWTKPHLAKQMLDYHLNQESDLASRRLETIDQTIKWLDDELSLSGKSLLDLGCGPGFYCQRFYQLGMRVTGIDFSRNSLEYARIEAKRNQQDIRYQQADYLNDPLPTGFDIITLIYCDLAVLSPKQRSILLQRMRRRLNPGGKIVFDMPGVPLFWDKKEMVVMENRLMGGFWAEGDYVGIQRTFLYPGHHLALDRYLIVEPEGYWEIFNWFQHFTIENLKEMLIREGFVIDGIWGGLTGIPYQADGEFIAVIASVSVG
ncbi:class I SAM-dependent methyltransferase [Magnetococcales bacterium HHB-1]